MWKILFPVLVALVAVGSGSLVGAPRDVDPTDSGVQSALDFAVAQHNRATNDLFLSQVAEVVSAQRQLVAGIKYIINVKMVRTTCRKDSTEVCAVQADLDPSKMHNCTFTVWNQPWSSKVTLLANTC